MDKPSFEESLRALAARRRRGESHPAPDELVAYRAGGLSVDEDDRIQEHLTHCRDCARLLLDLAEFEHLPPPPEEVGPVDARAEASWQRLRARLGEDEGGAGEPAPERVRMEQRPRETEEDAAAAPAMRELRARPPVVPVWRKPGPPWALAAVLGLCVIGLGLRTASLQQEVGILSEPRINVTALDLYPEQTRSGETPGSDPIGASSVLFLHLPEGGGSFPEYEVEVVPAAGGAPVWDAVRGKEEEGGLVTFVLPPRPLPSGAYSAHLYGVGVGRRELVHQYPFQVSPGTP